MFTSSRSSHQDTGLFKKATAAYLAYKALPFGSSKKKSSSTTGKVLGGYLAFKAVPKLLKWVGGGALLAYGLKYGYSWYNESRLSTSRENDNY